MKTQRSHRYVMRFLAFSFTGFLLISMAVFGLLVFFMDQKSNKSIYKVGELYMSGMNREISKNFENVIDLRFRQVEALLPLLRQRTAIRRICTTSWSTEHKSETLNIWHSVPIREVLNPFMENKCSPRIQSRL